jgi:exoribonuclease R
MPPRDFSDKPVRNAFTATDMVASCMHPITRYSDILTQRAFKTAIVAKYDPNNLNLKKQQQIMSESVAKANEAVKFMFDEEKTFKTLASLEYLENSGKDIFTGFPIMKTEGGSVIIILEYGIEAQMPSEYAKNFNFEPAMPYLFKVIAIGTEDEPTVVSLAE